MNYTYHGIMNTDYNRREDVSLRHICDCTPYCTYHCGMDAPQYVHVHVPFKITVSKCFITDITGIWMQRSMYTSMYLQIFVLLNVLLHTPQQYGCYPVCTHSCTFRCFFLLKVLLHTSQRYGRSPVCTR